MKKALILSIVTFTYLLLAANEGGCGSTELPEGTTIPEFMSEGMPCHPPSRYANDYVCAEGLRCEGRDANGFGRCRS